jgi:hypothetical protein
MASKCPKTNKEDTAGKRKHVTLPVPRKLEITKRLGLDSETNKNAIY